MGGGGLGRDDVAERAAGTQAMQHGALNSGSAPADAPFSDAPMRPSGAAWGFETEGRP
jgi:hypothetical protein